MKHILLLCAVVLLSSASLMALENETHCQFKPHFQANLDLKALGTGHMIHAGDFTIIPPYNGFDLDMPAGGPGLDAILGCRLKPYLFLGGGISLQWWLNEKSDEIGTYRGIDITYSPYDYSRYGMGWAFYFAPRFYIPNKKNDEITPYVDLGVGFCQFFMMLKNTGIHQYIMDFYGHIGVGVDIRRFNISAGYQYSYSSNGYLRLGYRF